MFSSYVKKLYSLQQSLVETFFFSIKTTNEPYFQRKIQSSGVSAYPEDSSSKLIHTIGVLPHRYLTNNRSVPRTVQNCVWFMNRDKLVVLWLTFGQTCFDFPFFHIPKFHFLPIETSRWGRFSSIKQRSLVCGSNHDRRMYQSSTAAR